MIAYKSIDSLQGPLVFIHNTQKIGYNELVLITDPRGNQTFGQVIAIEEQTVVVQLFNNSAGLQIKDAEAVFMGESKKIALSPTILGRTFNGLGNPIDDLPQIEGEQVDINFSLEQTKDQKVLQDPLPFHYRDINGQAINPARRAEPQDFIQTGISSIDLTNSIVKGQKIPIFSGSGLPDMEILTQIAKQAKTRGKDDKFVVVVATMGISNDQYQYLKAELESAGALDRCVMFVNLASDPVVERILTPRLALTVSEYLAYDLDFSVLTLMYDMTNYANAMREISTAKKEIPGRAGYPAYLYTDLAMLYERAGMIEGKKGSITQVPVLTMPNDDNTHPIPDLTGYITEGQILLDRTYHKRGYFPCIEILGSLSRLKDKGQGEGKTREDHSKVADQMFALVAESNKQEELALVLGQDSLTETGRKYLKFKQAYLSKFLNQGSTNRDIIETLDMAWDLFSILPREELKKVNDDLISKYGKGI